MVFQLIVGIALLVIGFCFFMIARHFRSNV